MNFASNFFLHVTQFVGHFLDMGNAFRAKKCFGHSDECDRDDQCIKMRNDQNEMKPAPKLEKRIVSIESDDHKWTKLLLLGNYILDYKVMSRF